MGDSDIQHPMQFGSTSVLIQMMRRYGVDPMFRRRSAVMLAASALTAPLRAYERLRHDRLGRQPLHQPPVFILGHWRGGTTQLHYLLSQDPQFAFLTTFQMFVPGMMISAQGWLKPLLKRLLPATRPVDNLPLGLDMAQEEEYALASLSPHSFYHQWVFPRAFREIRRKYALMDTDPATLAAWRTAYTTLLQKIAAYSGHKTLLIKNPTNTSRIRELLRLFPEARFIHIVRDPRRVFLSTRWLYKVNSSVATLHHVDQAFQDTMILENYRVMMERYLDERSLIPAKQLIEVRFEDLEQSPRQVAQTIYTALGLQGLEQAWPMMQRYLDSLGTYRKNTFTMEPVLNELVAWEWAFAFDAWGYPAFDEYAVAR